MFKHYFETIENVERGPVISLVIFFVFFIVMLIGLRKMDKNHVEKMKNLPIENGDSPLINNEDE